MVWGHPRGSDPAIVLQTSLQDDVIEPGMHVMFDCHGTLGLYCWDGGKTWAAWRRARGDGQTQRCGHGERDRSAARGDAAGRAGERTAGAHAQGVSQERPPRCRCSGDLLHGLGLSHMDLEQTTADGKPNGDWTLEEGMVVPLHLLVPGGDRERYWLEEVAVVTASGGRPLFSWGPGPILTGSPSAG
jgi:hypothetical protein